MEVVKIDEILRSYTDKLKYNSGFVAYKKNYVSNIYVSTRGNEVNFYGIVFDEHHNRSYTSMININISTRIISDISCDCQNIFNKKGPQVCSHIVATVLTGIKNLKDKSEEEFSEGDVVLNPSVRFDISQSSSGNLGGSLYIDGIDKCEYENVFQSYKDNYKYHLMPDGSYIDLKNNDLEKIFQIIDILGVYNNLDKMKIPNNKAIFLEKLLDDENLNFVNGKKYIDNVIKKYNKLKKK